MKKPKTPIKSIARERRACIAAFKKYPKSKWCWCCHHDRLFERIDSDGYMGRIRYIELDKPTNEKAVRFRNFRPIIGRGHSIESFNREWPNNTWDGSWPSIFSRWA